MKKIFLSLVPVIFILCFSKANSLTAFDPGRGTAETVSPYNAAIGKAMDVYNNNIKSYYMAQQLQTTYLQNRIMEEQLAQMRFHHTRHISHHRAQKSSYRSYGSTHYVRPYYKRNGSYIEGHLSGNPSSGVHCHNNVCY